MVIKKMIMEKITLKLNLILMMTLPLNKLLKPHLMTIIIRCVFSEDGKLSPQLLLDDTLYEL